MSTLENNRIMDYDLLTQSRERLQEPCLLIYYVLNGSLTIGISDKTVELKEKDFDLVNPFELHTVKLNESSLVMRFEVNLNAISEYYDIAKLDFVGNSSVETSERCMKLEKLLNSCIGYYYGKRSGDGRIYMKLNSIYYEIAELLIASFSVIKNEAIDGAVQKNDEDLIREMARYIHMNYDSQIHLEDLADHVYLSPTYVSRYFKKKIGINFAKYLTNVRLEKAVEQLEGSQKPMTRIAMDCGFPNLAAFNKAFREAYQISPKQYRNDNLAEKKGMEAADAGANSAEFRLMDYLDNETMATMHDGQSDDIKQLEVSTDQYEVLEKTWNRMINIGGVHLLLQKEIQDHLLYLSDKLGFNYVRIWDIYSPELHLNVSKTNHSYNFNSLDICLDFLVKNHLIPYIEMGFKPFVLLRAYDNYTVSSEREIAFSRAKEFGEFSNTLLNHLINRYGAHEVAKWMFELWCDPRWFPDGDANVYLEYFGEMYRNMKNTSPRTQIGIDFDRTYDMISFEKLAGVVAKCNAKPDFFSLYAYPTLVAESGYSGYRINVESDVGYLKAYLDEKIQILRQNGLQMPIHISEWSFTVINANVLNDSRFKGAYMMNSIMRMYDCVSMIGYWFGTDLFAEDDSAPRLLNGRCGLITHQGICKPSFWAMRFLNRLEEFLIAKTDYAMVTMNEFESFVIACHNFKELGIQYAVQDECDITIDRIQHLYENNGRRIIKLAIRGVSNGLYHVKTRSVNEQYGSVQDEWKRMGLHDFLTPDDVDYIRHISRPRIAITEQVVSDHTLYVTADLEAQELQLIHIFKHYGDTEN